MIKEAQVILYGSFILLILWAVTFLKQRRYRKARRKRKKQKIKNIEAQKINKKRNKKRMYRRRVGHYNCDQCGETWTSAYVWQYCTPYHTWESFEQQCQFCLEENVPKKIEKLKLIHYGKGFKKHNKKLCGLCKYLKYSCTKY